MIVGLGPSGSRFSRPSTFRYAQHIVTNPPTTVHDGLADAFVRKALDAGPADRPIKVAMLLNLLSSLAETTRTPFWRSAPPAVVLYAIDNVICWPDPHRAPPVHFTRQRYCWAIYSLDHQDHDWPLGLLVACLLRNSADGQSSREQQQEKETIMTPHQSEMAFAMNEAMHCQPHGTYLRSFRRRAQACC